MNQTSKHRNYERLRICHQSYRSVIESILELLIFFVCIQDYTEGEKLFSNPRHLQGISGINIVQVKPFSNPCHLQGISGINIVQVKLFSNPRHLQGISGINIVQVGKAFFQPTPCLQGISGIKFVRESLVFSFSHDNLLVGFAIDM